MTLDDLVGMIRKDPRHDEFEMLSDSIESLQDKRRDEPSRMAFLGRVDHGDHQSCQPS